MYYMHVQVLGFFYYWTYQFYQTSNDWFMHIEKQLNE